MNSLTFIKYDSMHITSVLLDYVLKNTGVLRYCNEKFETIPANSTEQLVEYDLYYDFWVIGFLKNDASKNIFKLGNDELMNNGNYEIVEPLFLWLKDNFQWAIFPWLAYTDFCTIAVYNYDKMPKIQHEFLELAKKDFVTEYKFDTAGEINFHSALVEEDKSIVGDIAIGLFGKEKDIPIIATGDLSSPFLSESFGVDVDSYKRLGEISIAKTDSNDYGWSGTDHLEYFLYQPKNLNAYYKANRLFYGDFGIIAPTMPHTVVFPNTTDLPTIEKCLRLLACYYSDLEGYKAEVSCMEKLLKSIKSIVIIDATGKEEIALSWIVTRDNNQIRKIRQLKNGIKRIYYI